MGLACALLVFGCLPPAEVTTPGDDPQETSEIETGTPDPVIADDNANTHSGNDNSGNQNGNYNAGNDNRDDSNHNVNTSDGDNSNSSSTSTSTSTTCGDGLVEGDEVCDDGANNRDSWSRVPRCNTLCAGSAPFCGDGVTLDGVEECDVSDTDTALCDAGDCTNARCGDGYSNRAAGEECDDGANGNDADGCNDACETVAPASCGDGIINGDEECDDSGESAECNANCTNAVCGDGIVNRSAGETCEGPFDYDTGTGCAPDCLLDLSSCGDGVVDADKGETCDPGVDSDCTDSCQLSARSIGDPCTSAAMDDDGDYSLGPIAGCGNVPAAPADSPGAVLSCARSVQNPDDSRVYWPGGYCTYYAQSCAPSGFAGPFICAEVAEFGDVNAFESCPDPFIRTSNRAVVDVGFGSATIDIVFCLKPCTTDSECRVRQYDGRFDEFAEYRCVTNTIDDSEVSYCVDNRLR